MERSGHNLWAQAPLTHSRIPYMWTYYNNIANLNSSNSSIGQGQFRVLLSRFKEAIDAATKYESQNPGAPEIQELLGLLERTKEHYESRQHLHWSQMGYKSAEFNQQIDQVARALDDLLMRFGAIMGRTYGPTATMIQQARKEDDSWFTGFIRAVDNASPLPGSFEKAYRGHDEAKMNSLTESVLQHQGSILSQDDELREEAAKKAADLTRWILGVTKQHFQPGMIIGRRLVGEWKFITSTQRNDIYTTEFVSGETVALKVLQDQMQGKDPGQLLSRFQRQVHLWHSLRYDHVLPFYGVGMKEVAGRTRIYGVAPYLSNRDAVTYQQGHPCSVQESIQIALDAASALRYLHERDSPVVHFNMCSENVLINGAGRGVLGGFGFSKELSASDGQLTSPATGLPSDTTCFRAPEYYTDPNFQPKTSADVWGWAMTTLQLIGGKAPFCDAPNGFQAVISMTKGERPDRRSYPGIQLLADPDYLWELLEECWAHEEAKRPTMDGVVARMRKVKDQNQLGRRDPPLASGPTPRRRGEGSLIEPVDGEKNQGTVQGRAPPQGRGQ